MKKQILKLDGWGIFFLYAPLLGILYFHVLSWLISVDWPRDEFSYCYFIPLIFLYLIYDKKGVFNSAAVNPSLKGLWLVGASIVLYWIGELAGEFYSLYLSFWLLIIGICWSHWGWRKVKVVGFPLFFLLTMFPLPNFIFITFSAKLKLLASQLGVSLLQLFGFPVFREGNIIDLGYTQLHVIDACSGLRSLNSLVVFGLLLAYLSRMAVWKKMTLVISSVPVAIITNGFRITMVAILYKFFGDQVTETFFHEFIGWSMFVIAMILLLVEKWILQNTLSGNSTAPEHKLDLNGPFERQKHFEQKLNSPISKEQYLKQIIRQPHFLLISGLLVITILLSNGVEFREKTPILKSFSCFPNKIGDWSGKSEKLSQKYLDVLDLSDYLLMDFKDTNAKDINLYVAYYESQRKGEAIHSPETCLPGSGWVFEKLGLEEIRVPDMNKSVKMNRALVQKGNARQLSYFWFSQRGQTLTNAYQLKISTFLGALTQQRTDGALVRIITPVYESEALRDADERLKRFISQAEPILSQFLPQ